MQNKTISFETAEAAVMQTWKSLLKQTNPYLVPILLPMIDHFKPLFQEFYDLGVSHGRTAQAVPEGFVLVPVTPSDEFIDRLADVICNEFDTTISGSAHCATEAYKLMIEAQEPAND